jgi:hypothetical protein
MPSFEGARKRPWFIIKKYSDIMTKGKAILYTGLDSLYVLQEVEVFGISRQSPREGGKFVGPAYRPP